MPAASDPRVNERIRAPQVRVIDESGRQLGVMDTADALRLARERELDLVEVASQSDPPVCRLTNYGKLRYERSLREKEARRRRAADAMKEMRFFPRVGDHDYDVKKRKIVGFLESGHRVRAFVRMRGRENAHPELAAAVLKRLAGDLADVAAAEGAPRHDGRVQSVIFVPKRTSGR